MQRADGGLCVSGGGIFQRDRHGRNEFSAARFIRAGSAAGQWTGGDGADSTGDGWDDAGAHDICGAEWDGAVGGCVTDDDTIGEHGGAGFESDVHADGGEFRAERYDECDRDRGAAGDDHAGFGDAVAGLGVHRNHDTDVQSGIGGECGAGDADDCGDDCGERDRDRDQFGERGFGFAGSEYGEQYRDD